jgi:hypothetical protein
MTRLILIVLHDALLQVALLVVMAQIGCYVPATFMSLR